MNYNFIGTRIGLPAPGTQNRNVGISIKLITHGMDLLRTMELRR
jgi:hypothetical protein